MPKFPVHLEFSLTRRQRLAPHFAVWRPYGVALLGLALLALPAAALISPWFVLWCLVPLWLGRAFVFGLVRGLFPAEQRCDLIIQDNALGYAVPGDRYWIWLDGLLAVDILHPGVWTLQHFNGTVVNIPASALSPELLAHLQRAAKRAGEPEVVAAVVERGRRLREREQEPPPSP